MNAEQRVDLLERLGKYILSDTEGWETVKEKASHDNPWFIPQFIDYQIEHIGTNFLDRGKLEQWIEKYNVPAENNSPKNVGVVMAGNIPLAGFHDLLSVFISGHRQTVKASSKDFHLVNGIVNILKEWNASVNDYIMLADQLKGCDAYIATGSNNTSRYFDYYFGRFPNIIRRNRTSVAILTGEESAGELRALSDDVYLYFGLGCRNVTKLYVPLQYDFLPLLEAFKKYNWVFDHNKYKNNYDYQLAVMMINNIYYMTNGSILLAENKRLFSPVSQLHYEKDENIKAIENSLQINNDIQCIVGRNYIPFGQAQKPGLDDYADKTDTLQFLLEL
jgi:hypothetical protein